MANALDVWMNGELVGSWSLDRGTSTFQYDDTWLQSPRRRPLSLSLPFVPGNQPYRGALVERWFENLLPDRAAIRERIRQRVRARSTSGFDLLAEIGRDCAGALQILPAGSDPGDVRRIDAEPLDEAAVARAMRSVTATSVLGTGVVPDVLRISIAGAQEKSALLRLGGRWYAPRGATPTTHILKLPLGLIGNMRYDMRDSVENEWLCMHFLQALGLPTANTEVATFQDDVSEEKVLVVERFDRQHVSATASDPAWIVRLPQEDFCQATGRSSDDKYEAEGGPTMQECLGVLASGTNAGFDQATFAKAQLAFWLLAATDGHAKNFSLFMRRDGHVMTPLYDVLSAWPVIGPGPNQLPIQKMELAMAVRGKRPHRELLRIAARHWRAVAERTGVLDLFEQMVAMVERAEDALQALESRLPNGFPEQVWASISMGVRAQRERFLAGVSDAGDAKLESDP